MRIISRSLSSLATKALNRVRYEYGEGYGLKVMGAWLTVEKDNEGEPVAIFYTSSFEDYFDLERIEISLKFYVGELEKPFFTPPIEVTRDPVEIWKNKQRQMINSLKEIFISQGRDETEATIEAMFLGSDFHKVREGISYECFDSTGVKNIIDLALKKHRNVELRIELVDSEFSERHIKVSILKIED